MDQLLEAIVAFRPALVVVANPDQPTGVAMSLEELRRVAAETEVAGSVLAVDEAYHMFGAESADLLLDVHENLVVIRTFSKAFGLAGLRLGYLLGRKPVIDRLRRLEPAVPPASLSLMGGVWALDHIREAQERIAQVILGREFLQARLTEAGMQFVPSLGNFVLIPAVTAEAAGCAVLGARGKGYLIKGPIGVEPIGPCVRVTVGPLSLMERFWADCHDVLRMLSAR
jgi:histidinol-phosphate aminotransferase